MLRFLRWIFGMRKPTTGVPAAHGQPRPLPSLPDLVRPLDAVPRALPPDGGGDDQTLGPAGPLAAEAKPVTHRSSRSSNRSVIGTYYESMHRLQAAVSKRDYQEAARLVRETIQYIPEWVAETCEDYGSFAIRSIPALEQGGTMLALAGDDEGLTRMRQVVELLPELRPWTKEMERHQRDRRLFVSIQGVVSARPNCLQTEIKGLVGEEDGHRIAKLIKYLDKAGKIRRIKAGRTYRLLPPNSPDVPAPRPKRIVGSHRIDREPPRLVEIDVESLDYVSLPRAPTRWDDGQIRRERAVAQTSRAFEIRDADWRIATVEKIPPGRRPDTAFRQMHPTDSGLVVIDDLGNASGLGQIEAAALRYDRTGEVAAKKGLLHDVYRVGVHPLGRGLIAMSKNCVVHAYDDGLDAILWGAKLPVKDGWNRVATPSREYGTSADVTRALALMGLALPLTAEVLNQRYWELAKRWHPDLNPGDDRAGERMKAVNAAVEVLSGVEGASLPRGVGATFVRELETGEINVVDWIYAASFAARSDGVYLAGYSGRVIFVNEDGVGVRVYDIGSVPRRIVDTGDYLYLLTDTRLYVVREDALHALVDIFDGGDVLVTQTAFGLLEKKRLRWFREDGSYLGAVLSRDPIRRVYATEEGLAVETRQHRALVEGVSTWWEW